MRGTRPCSDAWSRAVKEPQLLPWLFAQKRQ